jgi:exopolyphosphatase/guanosine-5'-triphosphate,3'-diphosphate pyrophosphatase
VRQAGVLDVGCHSALLTVARRGKGGRLTFVSTRKVRLGLHHALGDDGRLRRAGIRSVEQAVAGAVAEAAAGGPRLRPEEVFPFATSVIRDAPNREEVVSRVARATGVRLRVLPGEEEARLAYVAARRWAGAGAEPLLVLDVGGGTVEVAAGSGVRPDRVVSLPLGARRVTRDLVPYGVARSAAHLDRVRARLRRSLAAVEGGLPCAPAGGHAVACSKTFTQLARLAAAGSGMGSASGIGSASGSGSARSWRELTLPALRATIPLLARTGVAARGELPGITPHRAEQSLAGALVAEALMESCAVTTLTVCPWSTREGLLLEALDAPAATAVRHAA